MLKERLSKLGRTTYDNGSEITLLVLIETEVIVSR